MTSTLDLVPQAYVYDEAASALEHVSAVMRAEKLPVLTEQQWKYAHTVISSALNGGQLEPMVIEGPAGTGKTTLLVWIILALAHLNKPACICALTHKACSVLRKKLHMWQNAFNYISPTTIHTLFNLKPKRVQPGAPKEFVQISVPDLSVCSLVIVDECSMVGRDLYNIIVESCAAAGKPILFTGDSHQLQPINEKTKSKAFLLEAYMELTKVLRHDGAILNLATRIRKNGFIPVIRDAEGSESKVQTHTSTNDLVKAWLSEITVEPDKDMIMLSFKNKHRRAMNDMVRKALHGPDVARFAAGDVVIALEPLMRGDTTVFQNNQEIEIEQAKLIHNFEPVQDLGVFFKTWELISRDETIFYVLDDSEVENFKKTKNKVESKIRADANKAKQRLAKAKAEGRNTKPIEHELNACRSAWHKFFYPLEEFYADVDFKYALTIHKSQGSEWETVYVHGDYTDSHKESVNLLYVATTRASKTLNHVANGRS
jgi:exodeoxyribonuclease-5